MRTSIAAVGMVLCLTGCVTDRQTDTPRTATEELLISNAADRAAEAISKAMPPNEKMFLDTTDFDATDGKYAIGAVRDALLHRNDTLVDKKVDADLVVELRSGALATNDHEMLIGIPSLTLPIPLAGAVSTPKVALYDDTTQLGVAKFAATGIDPKTGALVASSAPQFGVAHKSKYIVLLFFDWSHDDLIPKGQRDPDFQ
jgi:hypothetical protein